MVLGLAPNAAWGRPGHEPPAPDTLAPTLSESTETAREFDPSFPLFPFLTIHSSLLIHLVTAILPPLALFLVPPAAHVFN